jgi:hypothetical protein
MSVNKLISIKNSIVDAMDQLNIDHDKLIPKFTRWGVLAEKEIGSKYQYVTKREVLKIEHCTACLPSDAVYIQTAVLGDFGCDCGDLMANVCGALNANNGQFGSTSFGSFLVVDIGAAYDGNFYGFVNHTIQNNKLVFQQDFDGKSVTIQYLAVEKDCDGFPLIGENHVMAIMWFIIWKHYMGKNNISPMEYGKMKEAKEEWHRECSHARAVDGQLTDSERRIIVDGILHNPYIGISLGVGMHTTLDGTWGSWN